MITAIINLYNRTYALEEQINAIKNQTIPPTDIMIWYNQGETPQIDISAIDPNIKVVYSTHNFKFHGRFAYALLAKTEYIAIFDDDTIPGKRWFENCLIGMGNKEGLYGSAGILLDYVTYNPHAKIGWNGFHTDEIYEVDLVGHAWFFKRDWLKYMWMESPISWENGEDIQFSHYLQKYGNIKTFVPPHPFNNKELWGSIKGEQYGTDIHASCLKRTHNNERDEIVTKCINNGWQTVRMRGLK